MDDERPFLIPLRRRWGLLILPILALLLLVFLVWIEVTNRVIEGVSNDVLALAAMGFFLFVVLVEVPFFLRRRAPRPEPKPDLQDEPPEPVLRAPADDERLVTEETQQGLRVLEYSAPAKSRTPGAVYAKTYVPVTKEHVLRVETLAALPPEL